MPTDKRRLLFLCTGNSCRSQMAEGWANFLGGDLIEATSAGIEAHGQNPRAIRVMAEAGVDISRQISRRVTPEMLSWADTVITVCGHADEHCPVVPPDVKKLHWPFDDPAKASGSEDEVMVAFRRTRDLIRHRIQAFVAEERRERHANE
jgi:arsenate reductase (thioredoxin)